MTMEKREVALARRHSRHEQILSEQNKTLPPLKVSDVVSIQNQHGPHPMKWNKSGTVVEVMGYDQYKIRVDGSGMIYFRNRKFLRQIVPFNSASRNSNSLPLEQAPFSAHDLPHIPRSPTQGQAGGDIISYVPVEQIEVDHAPQVPDRLVEESLPQHVSDTNLEEAQHPPDAVVTRQPSQEDQSPAPPPTQRPTRDRRTPGRFEDYVMSNITSGFNRHRGNQVLPAEPSGLPPGRR